MTCKLRKNFLPSLLFVAKVFESQFNGFVLANEVVVQTIHQTPVSGFPDQFHRVASPTRWLPAETAIIICDVWDSHHCVNAVRRVQEIAPRI
ncbi:MAG TPA: hypothetical protein VM260_01745, partial [Pirellula sp.]|nr:hypothetical protein [Pirellula sp.]